MINERAMRPSDILQASNGITIEVGNTDAEGRLTLADALVYADKTVGCEKIIDLATLTGACMVALGDKQAGLFTPNDQFAEELAVISKTTDKTWRLPLSECLEDSIKSKVADLKNIGGKTGGAITAALFLQHFVDPKKMWCHLDIAGPVWDEVKGEATGFGVKIISKWIQSEGERRQKE